MPAPVALAARIGGPGTYRPLPPAVRHARAATLCLAGGLGAGGSPDPNAGFAGGLATAGPANDAPDDTLAAAGVDMSVRPEHGVDHVYLRRLVQPRPLAARVRRPGDLVARLRRPGKAGGSRGGVARLRAVPAVVGVVSSSGLPIQRRLRLVWKCPSPTPPQQAGEGLFSRAGGGAPPWGLLCDPPGRPPPVLRSDHEDPTHDGYKRA